MNKSAKQGLSFVLTFAILAAMLLPGSASAVPDSVGFPGTPYGANGAFDEKSAYDVILPHYSAIGASDLASKSSYVIATSSLAAGTAGKAYSATLSAIGGTGPYRFSATGLPSGLTMSPEGVISGSTTVTGNLFVEVQVTDSANSPVTKTRSFSLMINDASVGSIPLKVPALNTSPNPR
ncbi:Ig domain-containing protein [Cohnella suwonensis]|uniref:Ig domain-containing protein n=1 Tax=Cohnella suwonensis TaxID=696072 RepID=A0ABW0LVS7_9BACL